MRTLTLLFCLCSAWLAPVTALSADLPLPEPLPGELSEFTQAGLPEYQIGPSLPMDDGSVVMFEDGIGADARLVQFWPDTPSRQTTEILKGFRVPVGYTDATWQQHFAGYASVRSSAGIWLVGPTIELLRPGKPRLTGLLRWPRSGARAVALADGSILVVGGDPWNANLPKNAPERRSVERVRFSGEVSLVSEFVLPVSDCAASTCGPENGMADFALLALGQGEIMLTGGHGNATTYIFDSARNTWRTSASMNEPRSRFSLSLLPDGRVLAAGGNENQASSGSTTELWDPKTGQWSSGPKLPLAMRDHSALLLENRTVILAGGQFAGVLAWDIDAPQWQVAAQHALARARAGVVYLGRDRLALVGGWHARQLEEAWGQRSLGYTIVTIARTIARPGMPIGLAATKGAFAVRGSQVFTAGGQFTSALAGSVKAEASASVELFDARVNTTRNLPALPIDASVAQAFWCDDRRLLAMVHGSGDAAEIWMGLIDIASGEQTALSSAELKRGQILDGRRTDWQLAGVLDGRAWLINSRAGVQWLDIATQTFSKGPRMLRQRNGFTARVLANGKVVVAGGEVESELVLSRVENCIRCPEKYIGFGQALASRRHEIFDPIKNEWASSAPSRAVGGAVAILPDGRVAKLGIFTERQKNPVDPKNPIEKQSVLLEMSDAAGGTWRTWALPPTLKSDEVSKSYRLLSVLGSDGALDGGLFLGVSNDSGELEWWWADANNTTPAWRQLRPTQPPLAFRPDRIDVTQPDDSKRKIMLLGGDSGLAAFEE